MQDHTHRLFLEPTLGRFVLPDFYGNDSPIPQFDFEQLRHIPQVRSLP